MGKRSSVGAVARPGSEPGGPGPAGAAPATGGLVVERGGRTLWLGEIKPALVGEKNRKSTDQGFHSSMVLLDYGGGSLVQATM
jgi:hypothetical protein